MVMYRVYCEFCRKQIHFRKAAVERNDFKVKKEAACFRWVVCGSSSFPQSLLEGLLRSCCTTHSSGMVFVVHAKLI